MKFFCENVFVESAWQRNVTFQVDDHGTIQSIQTDSIRADECDQLDGIVIPGLPNVHSHAFQRAFVGLSEYRTAESDSFWTWRNLMYRFLERLEPTTCYAIAKQLFVEMLTAGYTQVGEFQYIHGDMDGSCYPSVSRVSDLIVRAAVDVGMPICMMPVLYQRSGFNGQPLDKSQRRFFLDDGPFLDCIRELKQNWGDHPLVSFGFAFHSLRAVDPDKIQSMVEQVSHVLGDCPVHIHVAEQVSEVDQCLAATGQRPVELLFDRADVDQRWCLIHATHLTSKEIDLIAQSQATVGLCPMTEANLGDGVFPAVAFKQQGGRIAIGSDSHISINPFSELRMIEYAQRLTHRSRAILCEPRQSTGSWLYENTLNHGVRVLQRNCPSAIAGIAVGNPADFLVLTSNDSTALDSDLDRVFDKLVFFESSQPVKDVFIAGKKVVSEHRHPLATPTLMEYHSALQKN